MAGQQLKLNLEAQGSGSPESLAYQEFVKTQADLCQIARDKEEIKLRARNRRYGIPMREGGLNDY